MEKVLPEPVWPYANTVALYPLKNREIIYFDDFLFKNFFRQIA